jgi:hypothetical protein
LQRFVDIGDRFLDFILGRHRGGAGHGGGGFNGGCGGAGRLLDGCGIAGDHAFCSPCGRRAYRLNAHDASFVKNPRLKNSAGEPGFFKLSALGLQGLNQLD